jgi:hypothetical protein
MHRVSTNFNLGIFNGTFTPQTSQVIPLFPPFLFFPLSFIAKIANALLIIENETKTPYTAAYNWLFAL